jgi:hypothetical protein
MLACVMLPGLTGCKEAPPPPPPEPVSFDDLIAALDSEREEPIDARVQFSESVEIIDEDFARGMILLADAVARGDDEAMGGMLTLPAQEVLETLLMDGRWEEGVEGIEAVRVVYAGPYTGEVIAQAASALGAEGLEGFEDLIKEMGGAIAEMMGDAIENMSPEELQKMRDEAAAVGATEEELKQLDDFIAKVEAGETPELPDITDEDMAQVFGGDHGILLAIQEPNASYLLGWAGQDAGGDWLFTNVPSTGEIRSRASEWDGIGDAGFRYNLALAAGAPPSGPGVSLEDEMEAVGTPSNGEDEEEEEDNPRRRETPGGPIDVPGGSAE